MNAQVEFLSSVAGFFWEASFGTRPIFWLLFCAGFVTLTLCSLDCFERNRGLRATAWGIATAACWAACCAVEIS